MTSLQFVISTKAVPVHPALTAFVHPCTAESYCALCTDPLFAHEAEFMLDQGVAGYMNSHECFSSVDKTSANCSTAMGCAQFCVW